MTAHFNSINDHAAVADLCDSAVKTERRPGLYRNIGKRIVETALVVASLPVIIPVTLALALPIFLKGETPFYTQRRVGRGGRTFVMWKLRTMVLDADERLARHLQDNPDARAEWIRHQKLRQDPRITAYGRFLRKTSMDEIPQLWNVLRGEMALIGPRPMLPHQRAIYTGEAYYSMRPGMSGFWQVSDRNDCDFAMRVMYDEKYDREISLATDLALLVRTIGAVLRGTGV